MIAVQTNSVQCIEENALTGSEIPVSEGQCMSRLSRFSQIGTGKFTTVSRGYFNFWSRHLGFVVGLQAQILVLDVLNRSRHLGFVVGLQAIRRGPHHEVRSRHLGFVGSLKDV